MPSSYAPDPRPLDPPEYWEGTRFDPDYEAEDVFDLYLDLDGDPCCYGWQLR